MREKFSAEEIAEMQRQEKQYLDELFERGQKVKASKVAGVPEVAIFWIYKGKPIIDGTPVTEAEDYGDFKTHGRDHATMWPVFQRHGIAPRDEQYDEVPRGRVTYNKKLREYNLYADKCILSNKKAVSAIMNALRLPSGDTNLLPDWPHYSCKKCKKSSGF